MERHLKIPLRKMVIAVSHLTQELTQPLISGLIEHDASYQVITGFIQTMNYQIDGLLLELLSHSDNRLIDVCLPYICTRNGKSIRLLARYILLNKKLWGIKVCEHNQWKRWHVEVQPPPIYIQMYYRQNNIPFSMNQVLVGHFYLQLHTCRISLLFETQLINNNQLLEVYHRYRCDVYSVMANLQRDINKDNHSFKANIGQEQAIKIIKDFSKHNSITTVYAGFKIVPSLNCVYWSSTFIQQGQTSVQQSPLLLGQKKSTFFLCDLELTLRNRVIVLDEEEIDSNPEDIIEALYINHKLKYLNRSFDREENILTSKRYFIKWEGLPSFTLLNLWYLFKTINLGQPFVLSFPFTSKGRELFDYLRILSEYSLLTLPDYAAVYSTKLSNNQQIPDLIIRRSIQQLFEALNRKLPQLIYLYTDQPQEIRRLKLNKEYTKLICFCESLIPIIDLQTTVNSSNLNKTNYLKNQKIENACTHVLKDRYQTIDQMLEYFMKLNFAKEDIERSFLEVIPNKIRKYLKLIPLYVFLLHSAPKQIINEIGEAELRLKSRPQSFNEVVVIEADESKMLLQKIEFAKSYKNRVSGHLRCHRCDLLFKKELIYQCGMCQNILCFDCIDILMHHTFFTIESYKCILCKGNCGCPKCQINKTPAKSKTFVDNTLSNKDIIHVFNREAFSCSFCQIIGNSYSFIKIECKQCRQLRCYNCSKLYKPIDLTKQKDWICQQCDQFSMHILKQTKMQYDNIGSIPSVDEIQVQDKHKIDQNMHHHLHQSNEKTPIVTQQQNKQNNQRNDQINNQNSERNIERQRCVQKEENKHNLQAPVDKPLYINIEDTKQKHQRGSSSRSRSRENKFKHKIRQNRQQHITSNSIDKKPGLTSIIKPNQRKKKDHQKSSSSRSRSFQSSIDKSKKKQQNQKIWENKNKGQSIWSKSRKEEKMTWRRSIQPKNKDELLKKKATGVFKNVQNKGALVASSPFIFSVVDHEDEEHSY